MNANTVASETSVAVSPVGEIQKAASDFPGYDATTSTEALYFGGNI